ncbi:hypothetical protein ACMAUO_17250 [Gluconacetobacter sp. Hr-1-5]|uniref:hypothetical protein n=1 Tax=Gluconacetobacter sp. Hr-1-5 TaxID=3395370 RepID=UPI003B52C134
MFFVKRKCNMDSHRATLRPYPSDDDDGAKAAPASPNLMALAASLPLSTERANMRYQWVARFIDNERVVCDAVIEPFAREVIARSAMHCSSTMAAICRSL